MNRSTPRCRRPAGLKALPVVIALWLAVPILAAEEGTPDLQPNVPDGFDASGSGLATAPLINETLGLAMYRPENSIVAAERSGGQLVVTIAEAQPAPRWSISVQHMIVDRPTTPELQIEDHLNGLKAANRTFQLVENRSFTAGSAVGRLCYITHENLGDEPIATGWLILPLSESALVVFSILAMAEDLPRLQPIFEAAFGTIHLRSAAEISLHRRSQMDSGRAFLESLEPDVLRELVGTRQWARIYRPDPRTGSEREVGYSYMEVYVAKRGALTPDRPESDYTQDEQVEGLMVRLQGRIIGNAERGVFFDSLSQYWMAWDQSEEAWSVRGTQRQGEAERSEAETGLRLPASSGNPRPTLSVVRLRSSDYQRASNDWEVPDVYLSQALGNLVGRLLARSEDRPRELSYYFYNYAQATPQLTRRSDHWEQADDDSGNWTLTTRLAADAPPIVSTYRPDGSLIRTVRADGNVTVPTTLEQLRQIWRSKNLPMGQ